MEPAVSNSNDLSSFIDFLYDGLEGYVYLAARTPGEDTWNQEFFEYPASRTKLIKTIEAAHQKYDIYIGPSVYQYVDGKINSKKEYIKASQVVWADFDGNTPTVFPDGLQPSLIVQSSSESHTHCYWRLSEPLQGAHAIESLTRKITYGMQADDGTWDATRILRPPGTFNHKRSMDVKLKSRQSFIYDRDVFNSLEEPPALDNVIKWEVGVLPDPQDVILRHAFPEDAVQLLKQDKKVGERSSAMMQLAYSLAAGTAMTDVELFVILKLADDQWGKFKKRHDRERRLSEIVSVARQKYPAPTGLVQIDVDQPEDTDNGMPTLALDYVTFLNTEVEFEWVVKGMLMDQGNMLLAGQSGIGKTQLSLEFMKHIALGKDYLHYKIEKPRKIVMLSLEMGFPDLQLFMRKQDAVLSTDEREMLRENLVIIAHGESWPLNTKPGQDQLDRVLDHFKPDGLFVDSVGAAILGSLNDQKNVQEFINYNARIKKHHDMFLWYIHHTRKAAPGQKITDQSDVYGDQYLVNSATSSYLVLKAKHGHIRIRNVKNRLASIEDDYFIERIPQSLTFKEVSKDLTATLHKFEGSDSDDDGDASPSTTAGPFQL